MNILQADKKASLYEQPVEKTKTWPSTLRNYHKPDEVLDWKYLSSMNGLNDVHKLYCGGLDLDKDKRNVFVTGSLADIKDDFQNLVTYCANDTLATYRVLGKLLPEYLSRFPHPVTLAGVLEMSTSFLPVNRNWRRYLRDAEDTYADLERDLTQSLKREADRACHLLEERAYAADAWLWDLDWSLQPLKVKKGATKLNSTKRKTKKSDLISAEEPPVKKDDDWSQERELEQKFASLMGSRDQLYKKSPALPGYPAWYRSLCDKDADGVANLTEMTTSTKVVPKLLKLTWNGYPLYNWQKLGWGYLVPGRPLQYGVSQDAADQSFPLKNVLELFPPRQVDVVGAPKGVFTAETALHQSALVEGEVQVSATVPVFYLHFVIT